MRILLTIVFLCGCNSKAGLLDCYPAQGPGTLVEYEGCKVYWYKPECNQPTIFFTNCKGSTQWTIPDGKVTRKMHVNGGK